ncbi:MAG: helix-turn-helix transcriptional regulator [Oceanococcus sp.]
MFILNIENPPALQVPVILLAIEDVMRIVRCGRTKLYELITEGKFPPPTKIGSSSRWRSDDIESWINEVTGRAA